MAQLKGLGRWATLVRMGRLTFRNFRDSFYQPWIGDATKMSEQIITLIEEKFCDLELNQDLQENELLKLDFKIDNLGFSIAECLCLLLAATGIIIMIYYAGMYFK